MVSPEARKLRVLWATDGSENAHNAVPFLRRIILPAAERLAVLTIAPHSFLSGARPDPAFLARSTPAARQRALVEGKQIAEHQALELDPPPGIVVEPMARWGNPIEEILNAAKSPPADLIVLGAKGHSNLSLLVLGSVSQGVVQNATRPVLIARPGEGQMRGVLIGYDGTPPSRRAVEFIDRLAVPLDVPFHVVYVVEPFGVPSSTPISYRRQAQAEAQRITEHRHRAAQRSLDAVARRLRAEGRPVETEVLSGAAGPTLDDAARRHATDLIVVGSRKPSPALHYLLGSTAEKLVRHAHVSVLVVR